LALFQQLSLISPITNAFAIPLVSFVIVPLTLLGTLPPLEWLLYLAHAAMSLCMWLLNWLNALPYAVWTQHAPPDWTIVLGGFGVLWLLLPRGFPGRWLGSILLLPMFLVVPTLPEQASAQLTVFDVGQGLAVVVRTQNHALLYDTGPDFNSESNSGNRILLPAFRGMGITHLDNLILTHDDSDHTGGAKAILQTLPVSELLSSLPESHPLIALSTRHSACADGQSWEWDGVHFEMLHPAQASKFIVGVHDNDLGCVLRISIGNNNVLLAADIEKDSENRLLQVHRNELASTMLVVPHHGSKSSSTVEFVAATHPRYAVFTVGYRNHFGHPRKEVVERYRAIGSELLRSDEDGAISIEMDAQTFKLDRYRRTHARYWQSNSGQYTTAP
jgi:competence protein ComEC